MMSEKKVPAIRFRGFEDDWEQRKLGDIADSFEYGLNAAAKEFDGQNKYIRITDIDDTTHEFLQTDLTSPDTNMNPADNYRLSRGDILFARTGASVGKTYIYKETDGLAYYAGFLIRARIKEKYDPEFVFQNTLTPAYENYIRITSQRSGQPGVNAQEYAEYDLMVPSLPEQRKIGAVLQDVDNLITLHQRKLEKLKIVKKTMLVNCFPKNGEKVPKFRFSGFTDDWEQRKLGDVYSERNERGNVELDILSVSIHHGISQNELDTDELGKSVRRSDDKSLYKHVYYGDLVFNMMRAWQGAIGVVKNEGMVSPAYISAIPDDSVFPEFMDYCLRRKRIINQINNLSYGVTDFRKRLYWEPFTRVTIMMPSVDEQRKITDIFHQLDDLITLHQRELKKLQMIKKSMLRSMFV